MLDTVGGDKPARLARSLAGNPPCRWTSMRDSARMFFDFAGASPQGRMTASMRAADRRAISAAVAAFWNSRGATMLTLWSVHCADRTTAISRV